MCLDFLPELLSQGQVEKQVFAVWLAAGVMEKYPIPKSLEVATSIMAKFKGSFQRKEPREFVIEALPAIVTVCKAFPHFAEDAAEILVGKEAAVTLFQKENSFQARVPIDLKSKYASSAQRSAEFERLFDDTFQLLIAEVVLKGGSSAHLR